MKATSGTTVAVLLVFVLFGMALPAQQSAPQTEQGTEPQTEQGTNNPVERSGDAKPGTSAQPSNPSFGDSKVRIVRVSQVNGSVQMDRNIGRGFETAMPNLPITEGVKLQTGSGVAEVEFEDDSTLRVTPGALIEFPQLELRASGAKATTVNVVKGTVYVSLAKTKGNEFTLTFGSEKVSLPPSSHVRLELASTSAKLSVLDGNAEVAGPSGSTELSKKRTLTFDLADQSQPTLVKEVAENQYDAWDHQAVEYQKRYTNSSAFGNSPYTYGISDMNYYGSFFDATGCGSMWRPYFASAAWDPYGSGVWAYYSGAGYSWVSPYPWGWMPYHYGSWDFCPGVGWGWRPGGSWMGLSNAPGTLSPLRGAHGGPILPRPIRPPRPPITGASTLVPVNLKSLPISSLGPHDTFVFRENSAGLGIPRGNLGKLNHLSAGAGQHGFASRHVYSVPIATPASNERVGNEPSSMRREAMGRSGSGTYSRPSERGQGSSGGGMRHQSSGGMGPRGMGSGGMSSGGPGSGSVGRGSGGAGSPSSGGHR